MNSCDTRTSWRKSARYLVILRLATARTPDVRSTRLGRMTERLTAGGPIR
ncbi:hypothetical protein F0344_33225 [Streptomyces finlayi]|uniref:Uncharacterized protein n=1 Tax=Streptomyces finlayi TaxID=67296 RepID=A0A7G7BU02_9ACTN|nr:hypothetical protein [Streptomyces finlayi]QNE78817.1 hypothetical protein F0344_33225 [Streptomyces finlayi]